MAIKLTGEYHTDVNMLTNQLAALREELTRSRKGNGDLVDRLAAAEQRNAELAELLTEHANHVATLADALFRSGACMAAGEFKDKAYAALEHQQLVNAALKPAESGASE